MLYNDVSKFDLYSNWNLCLCIMRFGVLATVHPTAKGGLKKLHYIKCVLDSNTQLYFAGINVQFPESRIVPKVNKAGEKKMAAGEDTINFTPFECYSVCQVIRLNAFMASN